MGILSTKRSDALKAVVIEMLVDAGVSFDQCDCKYNMLLTQLPVLKLRVLLLTLLVSVLLLRRVLLGLLMALICWLGVYLSLEGRPLLI